MTKRPTPATAFARLADIIARLRAPDGCPWDREQTHASLRTHLIEETYETISAIDAANDSNLREELGDLLMQPVLHAQIASEENRFDIVDVLESISDKLVRRHPHVFGDVTVENSDHVLKNWDAIKRAEKAERAERAGSTTGQEEEAPPSILADVPSALPSLSLAMEVSKKAAKAGFEWPDIEAVMEKLREEMAELEEDLADTERATEELGDLLLTAVNVARWKRIDPELALRDAVRRFTSRFQIMEAEARKQGLALETLSPEQWDELWEAAKKGSV